MSAQQDLKQVERLLNRSLKKQTQDGLAKVFEALNCKGVAKEIKAGRKVTENTEYGIRNCVHPKTAPRVNPETLEFFPQTKRGMKLEEKFIDTANKALENGGFKRMSPSLLLDIRNEDKAFENRIKKLRLER